MIATKFSPELAADSRVLLFASGVSDSKQENRTAFIREENLLRQSVKENPLARLVYFSTCSIYDPSLANTAYIRHKIKMEKLIHEITKGYLICRTTNLVGKTNNTSTIMNYLTGKIRNQHPFVCWNGAHRNVLDIEDFYQVVKDILFRLPLADRRTVNIFNPASYHIFKIITAIERHYSTKARFTEEKAGSSFKIPGLGYIMPVYSRLGLEFGDDYLQKILDRYYQIIVPSTREIQI